MVEVIKTEPSVCVCLSVSTLTAEPFGVRSWNLVQVLTLIISWTSSKVKVIGQGHPVKNIIFRVLARGFYVINDKDFMCMCARNFAHAHAHFAHARNHEICTRAQMGSARGRCSNTLVFFS